MIAARLRGGGRGGGGGGGGRGGGVATPSGGWADSPRSAQSDGSAPPSGDSFLVSDSARLTQARGRGG